VNDRFLIEVIQREFIRKGGNGQFGKVGGYHTEHRRHCRKLYVLDVPTPANCDKSHPISNESSTRGRPMALPDLPPGMG
jgi:hypothetical protein